VLSKCDCYRFHALTLRFQAGFAGRGVVLSGLLRPPARRRLVRRPGTMASSNQPDSLGCPAFARLKSKGSQRSQGKIPVVPIAQMNGRCWLRAVLAGHAE
jgi:hypothetical protein